VLQHGTSCWTFIAEKLSESFPIRSGKQCRESWHNYLDPAISTEPWSLEEENLVFQYTKIFGFHWSKISKELPGRTENAIKNYFYSTVRKNLRRLNKKLVLVEKVKGDMKDLIKNPILAQVIFCNTKKSQRLGHKLNQIINEKGQGALLLMKTEQVAKPEKLEESDWSEFWNIFMGLNMNFNP